MIIDMDRPGDVKRATKYRAFLDGLDVTREAFYADSRRGVIRMYLRGSDGQFYVDPSDPSRAATVEKHGRVRLRRRKAVA